MPNYAVVKNDLVVNVVVGPEEYVSPDGSETILIVDGVPQREWERIDGDWVAPPRTQKPLEELKNEASLSRANFKLGLLDMGELDAVKAVMADPETPERVVIMWEDSARFNRMHPDLLSFAQVMGYSEQQLDQLFGVSPATNANTADFDTLRDLNGVDEVRAQAIIDGRPWTDVNDLTTIQGISQEMVDSWEITV